MVLIRIKSIISLILKYGIQRTKKEMEIKYSLKLNIRGVQTLQCDKNLQYFIHGKHKVRCGFITSSFFSNVTSNYY